MYTVYIEQEIKTTLLLFWCLFLSVREKSGVQRSPPISPFKIKQHKTTFLLFLIFGFGTVLLVIKKKGITCMCFDANMRYFERGCKFRAKVLSISKESELFLNGVRKGNLIECVLPSDQPEDDESVIALVTLPGGVEITVYESTDLSIEWLEFHNALQIPGMNAMDTGYLKSIGIDHE